MDIRFNGVEFHREHQFTLAIPDLTIVANRVTAVLGANGAGKTTLLRLIAGLDRPGTGNITVGEGPPDPRRRSVAFVFQEHVFFRRSLRENVELALRLRGNRRMDARRDAGAALELLGISALAERRPDEMSGGERRRGSLALALSLRAPVALLDEPLAGLDVAGVLAGFNATTVLVTHNHEEAFRIADGLVVMAHGRVVASGAKHDIAVNPRRREVADALGYAVVEVGRERRVAIPPGALRLGTGPVEFEAVIERVTDLVQEWDVLARVGDTRLHIALPPGVAPPGVGTRARLHAERAYDLR
jgi:ABC-type sulfate/molybdate transport systems ATPase subunit